MYPSASFADEFLRSRKVVESKLCTEAISRLSRCRPYSWRMPDNGITVSRRASRPRRRRWRGFPRGNRWRTRRRGSSSRPRSLVPRSLARSLSACQTKAMTSLWIFISLALAAARASPSPAEAVAETEGFDSGMFLERMQNVTAATGREAVFTCVVENAQNYKVAFLRVDTQTILTIDNAVITRSSRVSLRHSVDRDDALPSGKRTTWQLVVKDVHPADAGAYMCQLNTEPMVFQHAFLHVTVPPDILANASSSDVTASEGESVNLKCSASGYPQPNVTWRREDYQVIHDNRSVIDGPVLDFVKIQRHQMSAYLCIAANGVPPPVSRRIIVRVEFAPELMTYQSNVTVRYGDKLELHCQCTSWPPGRTYWTHQGTELAAEQETVDQSAKVGPAVTNINLRLAPMTSEHQGDYTCHCANRRGTAARTISVRGEAPVQQQKRTLAAFGHQEDEQSPQETTTPLVTTKRKKPEKLRSTTTIATTTTMTTTRATPVDRTIRPLQHQQPKASRNAALRRHRNGSSGISHLLCLFLLIILASR